MRKIDYYIDLAKKKTNCKSDSEFSLFLGNSRGTVNSWRSLRNSPDQYSTDLIADILEMDSRKITAELRLEFEKDELRREHWGEKVKEYGFADTGLLLVILSALALTQPIVFNVVVSMVASVNNIYYAHL